VSHRGKRVLVSSSRGPFLSTISLVPKGATLLLFCFGLLRLIRSRNKSLKFDQGGWGNPSAPAACEGLDIHPPTATALQPHTAHCEVQDSHTYGPLRREEGRSQSWPDILGEHHIEPRL
jgi:hypothetical protein